jgi:hypothetical protein
MSLAHVLAGVTAEQQIPDDATVTPGIEGFLTFFALAIIVVLLVLSMSKHLRRVDARAAEEAADEADRLAAEADPGTSNDDDGDAASGSALTDTSPESGEPRRPQP